MNRSRILVLFLAALTLTLTTSLNTKAQDDLFGDEPIADDFGDPGFGEDPDLDFDAELADSIDGGSAIAPTPDDDAGSGLIESAVVRAIRMRDPQTESDLLRTVDQLVRLDRPDLAGEYLEKLVALDLSDVRAGRGFTSSYGTAVLLRLSRTSELAPMAGEFANRVLQAARRISLDPKRLNAWAKQLGDEKAKHTVLPQALNCCDPEERAVEPIIAAMVAAEPKSILPRMGQTVIRQLGNDAVEPLIGQLFQFDPDAPRLCPSIARTDQRS